MDNNISQVGKWELEIDSKGNLNIIKKKLIEVSNEFNNALIRSKIDNKPAIRRDLIKTKEHFKGLEY